MKTIGIVTLLALFSPLSFSLEDMMGGRSVRDASGSVRYESIPGMDQCPATPRGAKPARKSKEEIRKEMLLDPETCETLLRYFFKRSGCPGSERYVSLPLNANDECPDALRGTMPGCRREERTREFYPDEDTCEMLLVFFSRLTACPLPE